MFISEESDISCSAMRLASEEPGCDMTVAALAALLHDADDHKLFKTEDNANARAFLSANGVDNIAFVE